jgi:hypothetical protein
VCVCVCVCVCAFAMNVYVVVSLRCGALIFPPTHSHIHIHTYTDNEELTSGATVTLSAFALLVNIAFVVYMCYLVRKHKSLLTMRDRKSPTDYTHTQPAVIGMCICVLCE